MDEDSPGKGRMAKVARTAATTGNMGPPATAASAYLSVCQQVGALRTPPCKTAWLVWLRLLSRKVGRAACCWYCAMCIWAVYEGAADVGRRALSWQKTCASASGTAPPACL